MHTTDIEQSVIGTLIQYPEWLQDLPIHPQPEWFTQPALRLILQTMQHLQAEGRHVDLLILAQEFHRMGQSELTPLYLTQLVSEAAGSAYITDHLALLQTAWMEREAARIGESLRVPKADTDIHTRLREAEDALYALGESGLQREATLITDDMDATLHRIDEASQTGQPITGVPTGFAALDRLLLGLQPTDLLILAARPGQGKTALGVSMTRQMMQQHIPVAFFSLEMGREQIVNRLLMQETDLAGEVVRSGVMDSEQQARVHEAAERMRSWPLYLDDTPSLCVQQLRQKARKLVRKCGVKVVIVDYLQLLTASLGKNATRENEVSSISRGLKCLAKELRVPVLALSQLNREPERAAEVREPRLSDLRESGAIEQDADVVMMLHRPRTALEGERELIVAKHRNGATGHVLLHFDAPRARFRVR